MNEGEFMLDEIVRTRRNLPHWEAQRAIYWVTFRLADSIPRDKLRVWREEREAWMRRHPQPWDEKTWAEHDRLFEDRFERWLDAGVGSCALARPDVREKVRAALLFFDGTRLYMHAAVIMPTHVHCVMEVSEGFTLPELLMSIKSYGAREANRCLGRKGTFWQEESYDHIVRNAAQYERYVRYVAANPVKAVLREGTYWVMEEREARRLGE